MKLDDILPKNLKKDVMALGKKVMKGADSLFSDSPAPRRAKPAAAKATTVKATTVKATTRRRSMSAAKKRAIAFHE